MYDRLSLSLATIPQIADELSQRQHESFILIYRDAETGEWVIDLNEQIDGLELIEVFQGFQTRMIALAREQQLEADYLQHDD